MAEKTLVEAVLGNPVTKAAVNAGAAIAPVAMPYVTPLVALLPGLVDSLAAERQSQRVEACIASLNEQVAQLKIDLAKLSDDQFKFIGECAISMLSTVDSAKLEYLKCATLNSLSNHHQVSGVSDAMSRLIRDISSAETAFVIRAFAYKAVNIDDELKPEERQNNLIVRTGTEDELHVGGLIRLGLLYAKSSSWDAAMYEWSPLTAKFIALVTSNRAT